MAKNPKSFRMSDKATENLRWLVDASGANETAVIEMALAYFRKGFAMSAEPAPWEFPPDPWDTKPPEIEDCPPAREEDGQPAEMAAEIFRPRKKRKRKH